VTLIQTLDLMYPSICFSAVEKYIDPLVPLRSKYEDLCGRMSSRFYDEARFFSKEVIKTPPPPG
jgi:hypothetical protein